MRKRLLAVSLLIGTLTVTAARSQTLDWQERYALSADRITLLNELIPGTETHYYYHCLHYQVTGDLDQAEALLNKWKADERARYSGYLQGIEDRQRLLTYDKTPARTITYLRDRLGLRLDHPAPIEAGKQLFPAELDPALIAPDALLQGTDPNDLTKTGLRRLAAKVIRNEVTLDPNRLAGLLNRVDGPWLPDLEQLVILEWKRSRPEHRSFGDRTAHQWLTLEQLQKVAQAIPALAIADHMVEQTLLRLRPTADEDMRQQPDVRLAYLERLERYVMTLPEAYVSLKAATLYQRLQHDQGRGLFDRERLLTYLRLPRNSALVPPPLLPIPRAAAELEQDFDQLAFIPKIGNEEPLIRSYLEHFFKDADSTKAFEGLLKPDYLKTVFAETKLLHGVEPAEQWYSMLEMDRRQTLRDRVELTLAPTNPRTHVATKPSELIVDIKHVDKLVVRVYQLNTHSYYRTHQQLIDTDLDLDGLVPTKERELTYSFNGVRRHREVIELPEIEGRGVWIVDLLGGGLRTRAMIRRGDIQYAITSSANGQRLIALDEQRQPIANAKLVLAQQELSADENGVIEIGSVDQATPRQAILFDSRLAVPVVFPHQAEQYELLAGMFLDEQQLQTGQQAELLIRPRLMMSGQAIDPGVLENTVVTVTATDLDGISTTKRYEQAKLSQGAELTIGLRVLPRLATLSATLTADVRQLANNEMRSLSAKQDWSIAGIRATATTIAAHLTRSQDQWLVETRGRAGEIVTGQVVNVTLHSDLRTSPVHVQLQSDAQGQIKLGTLEAIDRVELSTGQFSAAIDIRSPSAHWPHRITGVTDRPLYLPLPNQGSALSQFRLLSLRNGDRPAMDVSNKLRLDAGRLVVAGLDAGDYHLLDLELGHTLTLMLTAGTATSGVAVGQIRQLELLPQSALGIESVERTEQGLKVKLAGATPLTRLHVVAHRFVTGDRPLTRLRLPDLPVTIRGTWHATSGYISDLRLGEEYQYVMRRQYAAKYPGVMLPQPGLILNPWETQTTDNTSQSAATGDAPTSSAVPAPAAPAPDAMLRDPAAEQKQISLDYDFLRDPGVTLFNLQVDPQGIVLVPADAIKDLPVIDLVAADPLQVISHTVYDKLPTAELEDLRLAKAIAASRALAFARGVVLAGPDQPLDLKSFGTAQVQMYASVADLIQLFCTLQPDARLKEFLPLAHWHQLDFDAKRAFYGRMACHELHLFLAQHDRVFFQEVVRPYLANKLEKQFIDHYLLESDLTPWTEMWRYQQLNAAEKVLLARRIPAMQETVRREFRELVALVPDDADLVRRLVESGLADKALEEKVVDGFDVVDGKANEFASPQSLDFHLAMPVPSEMGGMGAAGSSPQQLRRRLAEGSLSKAAADRDGSAALEAESEDRFGLYSMRTGKKLQQYYQHLSSTKQWAESQWDRVRTVAGPELGNLGTSSMATGLIPVNPFWKELAEQDGNFPALSQHLLRPVESRHAALMALALCGLPLQPGDIKLPSKDVPFAPSYPIALVTKRLVELEPLQNDASLLVAQRFSELGESTDPKQSQPIAPAEFVMHRVYKGEIVLTNPTPAQQSVDVLWQIPEGGLTVSGGQPTDSRSLVLEPFAVQRIEYQFYFPRQGSFSHYPVCVSSEGKVIARGQERKFTVVESPTSVDSESWNSIAKYADAAKIDAFLANANLRKIDWMLIAHRMRELPVYEVVTKHLASNQLQLDFLWAYAFLHQDKAGMQRFLNLSPVMLDFVGPVLASPILSTSPVERGKYEFLEYSPLVVARIHPLKAERDVLNPTFKQQYLELLRTLAYQLEPSTDQQLSLVYYMMIQNRIEDALAMFATVDDKNVKTQLQYDYLAAYLALHRRDYATATKRSSPHLNHPVPRWRERFNALADQLRQRDAWLQGVDNLASQTDPAQTIKANDADLAIMDREKNNATAATREPYVKVETEGGALRVEHRNTAHLDVHLYPVDLELLFSKTPFVRDDLATMAVVEPLVRQRVETESKDGVTMVRLTAQQAKQTLLVEVVAGGARSTTLYYGGTLVCYASEGFGQLQVSDSSDRRPVEGAYVKVYAKQNDGTIAFYKDGYTDLRGRFDYVSLSTDDLASVQRFAVLVMSPEQGATLLEASPPAPAAPPAP